MNVQEAPPRLGAHDLRNYLDAWIKQNADSRDIEHRWLAAYANDLMHQAYNVKVGNHDTIKKQVHDFRLQEIELERLKLTGEVTKLNGEEARLLREIEQLEHAK